MIPLGVLASARVVAAGGGISVVQHKSASTNTVTLDAAPTAGNRLIVAIATITGDLTPNHTATTRDAYITNAGWHLAMWSGTVESGASATVTTAPGSILALAVWEIGPSTFDSAATFAAIWTNSMNLSVAVDAGALGIVAVQTQSTTSAAVSGGSLDSVASDRAIHGHTDTPESTVTVSWTGTTEMKQGIMGAYR